MRRATATGLLGALGAVTALTLATSAHAVNPLEYPENGAGQFSRGGAALALGTDPIALHYNPAAIATQSSAFSIDVRLNYQKICFDRHGENGAVEGPNTGYEYRPACNDRGSFPLAIPAIALVWRASDRLGIGAGLVPPSAYGTRNGEWSATEVGFNANIDEFQQVPSPYRYMTLGNQSTILFPTLSIGYEVVHNFRVGVGFIAGVAMMNVSSAAIASVDATDTADRAEKDTFSRLETQDLFVPGGILAVHWSVTRHLDVGAWGRYLDSVRTTGGKIVSRTQFYSTRAVGNRPAYSFTNPICTGVENQRECSSNTAVENEFGDRAIDRFELPLPPEVRAGIRFHMPRSEAVTADDELIRDPLHDDVFDIELDGSFTKNSHADTIKIRFLENNGVGAISLNPAGNLPPNADRPTGFKDSWGLRLGGQWNVMRDKLALLAGGWYETESQDPELMNVSPAGPERYGIGGGITLRQEFIDFTFGYQRHMSSGLDNHGRGRLRATVGAGSDFNLANEPPGVDAADRTQFRSAQTVNNGRLTQSANVFTLGGVVRF